MNLGPWGSVRAVSKGNSTHQEKEDYLISPTSLLEAQKSKGLILNVKSLLSWATKSPRTVTAAAEITLAPWNKSHDKHRQFIKKQRHHFADKGPYSQSYGFSGSLVRMLEVDHKKG